LKFIAVDLTMTYLFIQWIAILQKLIYSSYSVKTHAFCEGKILGFILRHSQF